MHYGVKDFAVNRSNDVMRPLNPLYQLSLGQQVELSFSDIHAINVAYCNTTCSSYPPLNCQRRGYRHPNNCSRCACPDGFGGLTCERVADPVNAVCGGTFNLSDTDQLTIKSPGYDSPGYYLSYQECSWLITVPRGYYVQLQFVGVFYIFGNTYRCAWHWVEVKYKSDLGLDGPRFCWTAHSDVLTSESNEMLVIFKSNFLQTSRIRGFQANITVVAMPSTNTVSTLPSATSTLLTTTNNPESTSAGVNHSASVTSTLAAGRITTHRSTANSMHVTCLLHILAASAAIVFTAKIYLL
jgi:astacin